MYMNKQSNNEVRIEKGEASKSLLSVKIWDSWLEILLDPYLFETLITSVLQQPKDFSFLSKNRAHFVVVEENYEHRFLCS